MVRGSAGGGPAQTCRDLTIATAPHRAAAASDDVWTTPYPDRVDWPATVIWWHLYPLRFVGGEDRMEDLGDGDLPVRRLGHLVDWLDYVVELGCNGLLLAPIFASVSHGYDTLDHFRIDPRLGDDKDLDRLVRAAKDRGLRILLDGVFNHLAGDHEIVRRARAAGPGTDDGRWLRWEGENPRVFEGNFDLVELDLTHPPVADFVVEVMGHWLDRGADGWRLDAAYSPGAEAWAPITRRVKDRHPDCWLLGEVIHGDYPEFVTVSGVDSITQYELWHGIWHSLNTGNLHELDHALGRHARFCETFRPQTFVGNHDVTRIATKLHDERHLPLAVALLMLLPGIPSIYAGDEQAFDARKLKRPRGDDAVRPPFPATPEELLPFGRHVYDLHRRLIGVRRDHPWLVDAALAVRSVTNRTIVIDLTGHADQRMTLALNVSDEPFECLAGATADGATGGSTLTVAPHDWAVVLRS